MRAIVMDIASCLLGVVLVGCGTDDDLAGPAEGSVTGVLTELESGEPVDDARVALFEPSTLRTASASTPTDTTGRYFIGHVPPGEYALVVYHDNLVIFERPSSLLHVSPGRKTRWDLRMQTSGLWDGSGPRVSGTVRDATTGEPIEGAQVGSSDMAGLDIEAPLFGTTLPEMSVTDAAGRFTLKYCCRLAVAEEFGIPPLAITKAGYEPYTLIGRGPEILPGLGPMLPTPDSVLTLEVRLRREVEGAPRGSIRGRLSFAGQPVSGVQVGLSLFVVAQPETFPATAPTKSSNWNEELIAAPLPDRVAISDPTGAFQIGNVPFGTYRVIAAYRADDRYVAGWLRRSEQPLATIADTNVVDVGDLALAKSMRPIYPLDGAVDTEPSPEIQWEPLTGLPAGYTLVDYSLNIDDDYTLDLIIRRLHEPRWQVPVKIRPNAHMRWNADARVVRAGSPDTLILGKMERAATFTVGSDVTLEIGAGTSPVVSWVPAIAVSWFSVSSYAEGNHWVVVSDTNAIFPPVHYGEVPEGAQERQEPTSLTAGEIYFVVLARENATGNTEMIAVRQFTP